MRKIDIEAEATGLVKREKTEWETGTAFVTDKVAFQMRNLIRDLRKNYYGIFNTPIDPQTGKKKIWIPLTESLVESVVKNIDLDTKDIDFISKKPGMSKLKFLVKNIVRGKLHKINFGEKLDDFERRLAIDGTAVWKTIKMKKDGKIVPQIKQVDLLNFYIDPVASSIQETESVIERAVVPIEEFRNMKGLINQDKVKGERNVERYDGQLAFRTP